ncbi:MAG TPA: SSI family serine proteinase inhibitor [Gaiellaceae bacterium]|nr:SSI family serine proteinase inhibitor [Gaiellaceae bacterium]
MRVAAAAAAVLAAAAVGCGSASSAPADTAATGAQPATSLTITFWPEGRDAGAKKRWTLRCGPAGGTHPQRVAACRKLAAARRPFAPVPPDVVCIQLYGGPQQALVTGTHRGARVHAAFGLRDGCQIERFKRVAFLVPGFSVGAGGATS